MEKRVNELTAKITSSLIKWRRDFHQHPEPGWSEFRTASIVADKLQNWGYSLQLGRQVIDENTRMGVPNEEFLNKHEAYAKAHHAPEKWLPHFKGGFTGVVGVLDTGRPGPVYTYRFDMDALEIQETSSENHLPVKDKFVSNKNGVMHACGHDAHTAIGLGTAYVLSQLKEELQGKIKLIFQPAEEGVRGAKSMVEAGIVDDTDIFIGTHIGLGAKLGELVCSDLGFLATTKADVLFRGVAAHAGANPEKGNNALLAAASAAINLHAISRHSEGTSRINVGELHAGSSRNIIPNTATLKIETRGETTAIDKYMYDRAVRIVQAAADMYDVECSLEVVGSANSGEPTKELLSAISNEAGKVEEIHTVTRTFKSGGSEDATHMMSRVQQRGGQAAYLVFGTTLSAGHHNETFDLDENVLPIAVKTLVLTACSSKLNKEGRTFDES